MWSRNLLAGGEEEVSFAQRGECWWNCPVTDSKAVDSVSASRWNLSFLLLCSPITPISFFPIFFMGRVLLCFPGSQLIKIPTREADLADMREVHERQLRCLHEPQP